MSFFCHFFFIFFNKHFKRIQITHFTISLLLLVSALYIYYFQIIILLLNLKK